MSKRFEYTLTREGDTTALSEFAAWANGEQDNASGQAETDYICSVPGLKEQFIEGMNTPLSECATEDEVKDVWKEITVSPEKNFRSGWIRRG